MAARAGCALTRRGRQVGRYAREIVRATEARWARELGAARIAALVETLRAVEALPDAQRRRSRSIR